MSHSPALPHIDDLIPFSTEDEACLAEMKEVLRRHGKLGRFGLSLMHNHFEVADDEMLLEECDVLVRL